MGSTEALAKNAAYWAERAKENMNISHKNADYVTQRIINAHDDAVKAINSDIDRIVYNFAKKTDLTIDEAKDILDSAVDKKTLKEIFSKIDRIGDKEIQAMIEKQVYPYRYKMRVTRAEAVKMSIKTELGKVYSIERKEMTRFLSSELQEHYYRNMYTVSKGLGYAVDFSQIPTKKIEQVLKTNWKKSNYSDRIWNNFENMDKRIEETMIAKLLSGKNSKDMAAALAAEAQTSKFCAERLLRTETTYISTMADLMTYNEIGIEELQIVASLDGRTCEICQEKDGNTVPVKKASVGDNVPAFHPFCRCCTIASMSDLRHNTRIARDENGNNIKVPADTTYSDWKSMFTGRSTSGTSGISSAVISSLTTSKAKTIDFKEAATIKEAEAFATNELGVENVSYKGVDVATANAWNEGLTDSFNRFPELKNNFGFVGEAHERNKLLRQAATDYYFDNYRRLNTTLSDEALRPYVEKNVNSLMRRMSVSKNTLAQSWSPTNQEFKHLRGVTVNRDFGKNYESFSETTKYSVTTKFHPVGCESVRSVLDHEIGHQLDDLLGIRDNKTVQALFDSRTTEQLTNDISTYAWQNGNSNKYSEMIAEAWAEYCNNPTPREISKTVGELIESEYNKKFGN